MILTEKAKEDFGLWHFERNTPIEEYKNFYDLSNTCKNALMIDFFDSVGVHIHIEPFRYKKQLYFKQYVLGYKDINEQNTYFKRTEATEEAIKKANKIYNKN